MMFRRTSGSNGDNSRSRENQSPQHNTGVINSGFMGNVQNQPGAIASTQSQVQASSDPDFVARWTQALTAIDAALTRDRIANYDEARVLLTMVQQQRTDEPAGRAVAQNLLQQLSDRCGGAPGIASLVSSALSLVTTAAG